MKNVSSRVMRTVILLLTFAALLLGLSGCDLFGGPDEPAAPEEIKVSVTASAESISAGERVTLTPTVTGTDNKNVSYSISDPDLLMIDGNVLSVLSSPKDDTEVTIYVTSAADSTKMAQVTVTVKAMVIVGTISAAASKDMIYPNETANITVSIDKITNRAFTLSTPDEEWIEIDEASSQISVKKTPSENTDVSVVVRSVADPTLSATVKIRLLAPTIEAGLSSKKVSFGNTVSVTYSVVGYADSSAVITVSDEGLLSVSEKTVTAIGKVEENTAASVTVTAKADPSLSVTLPLTVLPPEVTVVAKTSSTFLREGWTCTLDVEILNAEDQGYTAKVSPSGIVTLESGVLTMNSNVASDRTINIIVTPNADPTKSKTILITAKHTDTRTGAALQGEIDRLVSSISGITPNFSTKVDFGKWLSKWNTPAVYPTATHPRIFVNADTLETVQKNLTLPENSDAYKAMIEWSLMDFDGILEDPGNEVTPTTVAGVTNYPRNFNWKHYQIVEAKAFRYLMTGEELYGYQAIKAMKNVFNTIIIKGGTNNDSCRYWGQILFTAAVVYDWCYDLLTDADKDMFLAAACNKIGPAMEIGYVPGGQSAVGGHGCEAQLLRDWFSFAIAVYDADGSPYNKIYNFVAGRIMDEYVPGQNYMLQAGVQFEGSSYGPYRFYFTMMAQIMMSTASGTDYKLFSDDLRKTAMSFFYLIRPDGEGLRLGDDEGERSANYNSIDTQSNAALLTALYFKDGVLKGECMKHMNDLKVDWSKFYSANTNFAYNGSTHVNAIIYLCLNDPTVETSDMTSQSLLYYAGYPSGSLIARSSHEEDEGVMIYMKVGESWVAGHEHRDAGQFQIYYKGALASDSGSYYYFATEHDLAYFKQTIAHNSLLIYNTNGGYNPTNVEYNGGKWIYSGGQTYRSKNAQPTTLEQWTTMDSYEQCKVIGVDYQATADEFTYAYLAGDLTGAYDPETVDEVKRYMVSVMTGDPENPMAFVVFDHITSDDAAFKKTFLLHCQNEPVQYDDITVIENGGGRLVVQSLGARVDTEFIGGEGMEFWIGSEKDGYNYSFMGGDPLSAESGWGRVEISPAVAKKTNDLLTVMYVTDAGTEAKPIKAREADVIKGNIQTAVILGNCFVFPTTDVSYYDDLIFDTYDGDDDEIIEYKLCGLPAASFTVFCDDAEVGTYSVEASSGMLKFAAHAGRIKIVPGTEIKPDPDSTLITFNLNGGTLPEGTDLFYHYVKTDLPTPVKKNAFFGGWYTDPDFASNTYKRNLKSSESGDIVLYAKWFDLAAENDFSQQSTFTSFGNNFAPAVTSEYSFVVDETDPSKNYLVWTGNGGGPQFSWYTNADSMEPMRVKTLTQKDGCFSIMIALAANGDDNIMEVQSYAHDADNHYLYMFKVDPNGKVYLTNGGDASTLYFDDLKNDKLADEDGFHMIRMCFDFNAGEIYVYDADGSKLSYRQEASTETVVGIIDPVKGGAKDYTTAAEWREVMTKSVFCLNEGKSAGSIRVGYFAIASGNIFEH